MPYTITPAESGRYIIVKVVGEQTRLSATEQMFEANKLGSQLGVRCYLFDMVESRNVESMMGNYKWAYSDARSSPDRRACVAILVDPEDRSHDFVEDVSRLAGYDITIFRDRHEAIAHLINAADRFDRIKDHEPD